MSPLPPKPQLMAKIWDTPKIKSVLKSYPKPWLYDGRKLAWSTNKVDELRITTNIDEEKGRPANDKNTFYVHIRNTGTIRLNALRAYLQGEMDWDNSVLECMSTYNLLSHSFIPSPPANIHSLVDTNTNH